MSTNIESREAAESIRQACHSAYHVESIQEIYETIAEMRAASNSLTTLLSVLEKRLLFIEKNGALSLDGTAAHDNVSAAVVSINAELNLASRHASAIEDVLTRSHSTLSHIRQPLT